MIKYKMKVADVKLAVEALRLQITYTKRRLSNFITFADVAKLADALDLGSSVFDVGVRFLSSAPMTFLLELFIEQIDTNIILKRMVFFCREILPRRTSRVLI